MKHSIRLLSCVLLLSGVLPAIAQEQNQPASSTLNLLDVYQLAVKNDAQIQTALSSFQAVQEAKPQAFAGLLPSLSASAQTSNVRSETTSTNEYRDEGFSISLSQPVFNWQTFSRFDQAKKEVLRAEVEYQLAEQQLILRVTERYLNTLTAEASLSLATDNVKAFQQQLEQAQFRFEVGIVAITDVHDAQARHDLALASKISAEDGVAASREALLEIIQHEYDTLATLNKDFAAISPAFISVLRSSKLLSVL